MYKQVLDPVGDSLFLSALVAMIPLATLFALLGGLKLKSHWAGLLSLLAAILVAVIAYSMPVGQALDAGLEGAAFGLFPIMWIVWNAIWIFNMTEDSGHFAVLRRSFGAVSDDQRIQAVIIAFSFGALLEALAGFGTPVAITATMLVAFGFKPMKAASVALVANTAPVAFGAIAIPIVTLAGLTEIPKEDLGAMVGRQTPLLALFVPLILVGMVDGWRGVKAVWPAALIGGVSFAVGQFACSNYLSVELTDIVASLLSVAAMVGFLRVWQPGHAAGRRARLARRAGDRRRRDGRRRPRGRDPPPRGPREGLARRHPRRLRAVPDHHRRLRPRPVGPDQGPDRQGRDGVRLAGAGHPQRQGRGALGGHLQAQLAARGRHAAADLRPADDGVPARLPRQRRQRLRPHDQPAQVGDA